MRTCKTCGVEKANSQYWRQASRKDGLQASCIECMTASHKSWASAKDEVYQQERRLRNQLAVDNGRSRDPLGQLLRSIKARAKATGMEFGLNRADVVIPEFCPVLGIRIYFARGRGNGLAERDCRPSVDRIDNSKGYTPDNIVVVSYRANRLKSDATLSELEAVAAFYRGIDEDRNGNTTGRRNFAGAVAGQFVPVCLPELQPEPKEEERSVPERDKAAGWDRGLLPSLRMEVRGQL